jgi:galactokinase
LLEKKGARFFGLDLLFSGDIPMEAGLSSSAAFVVSTSLALSNMAGIHFEPDELALFAQQVENQFMGVACGILDQMASAASKKNQAMLLDCRDLSYEHIPIKGAWRIVVCHTGVTRSLATSKFNDRKKECLCGFACVQKANPELSGMRDLKLEHLEENENLMDKEILDRITHVVHENTRVIAACDALRTQDIEKLGGLISQSHKSLRDLYKVSCHELDVMVELAEKVDGCFGARLVGAGFGGCAIAIVHNDAVKNFCDKMKISYYSKTQLSGNFMPVDPGPGATAFFEK